MSGLFAARVAILGLVALTSLGCVSRGRYDAVVEENERLRVGAGASSSTIMTLVGELTLAEEQVAQLEREQRDLADEMARWQTRGEIKLSLLRDGLHLILPADVLFASGSVQLTPGGKQIIEDLVTELGGVPYQIAVLGHSDNVPVGARLAQRFPTNWELSGARAARVVRELEAGGIPTRQLVALSLGETRPAASNDTPEGRNRNRRIEVRMRPVRR